MNKTTHIQLLPRTMRLTTSTVLLALLAEVVSSQSSFTFNPLAFMQSSNTIPAPSVSYTTVFSTAACPQVTDTVTSTVVMTTCPDCTGSAFTTVFTTVYTSGTADNGGQAERFFE